MRRLDALLGRKPQQVESERFNPYPQWTTTYGKNKADPISFEFMSYVDGALKANGAVFALCRIRAAVFSEARFQFQALEKGRPGRLYGEPSLGILERPWAGGTTGDMLSRMLLDADLAGNSYWVLVDGELVRLRPDWVQIVLEDRYDPSGNVVGQKRQGYLYYEGGYNASKSPAVFFPEDICHFAPMPDPATAYKGMSWLTPVIKAIQADQLMTDHKANFFENAATPNLAVSIPLIGNTPMAPTAFTEFVDAMDRAHKGSANAGKTLYTANGADVTVIGADMQAMNMAGIQGATQTQLANAARVPVTIAGFSEGLAGSSLNAGNYQAAKRTFADTEVRNLWRNAAGSFETLVPAPAGSRLWYDERDVAFLREDEKDRAEIAAMDGQLLRTLGDAGFDMDTAVSAIGSDYDWSLLKHSGLFSVQLQPPGTVAPTAAAPTTDPTPGA